MPIEWIDYQQAVKLLSLGQVQYSLGETIFHLRGGVSARTGVQSTVAVNAILATTGRHHDCSYWQRGYVPPLTNTSLFRRDQYLCLYCGQRYLQRELSRDHVTPRSRGGVDQWNNVVTACKRCNNHKAGRTPEEAGMQLLAVPFTPTHAEYIYLQGKRILADQMDFLLSHFPRNSPLLARIRNNRKPN